jgi:hypothetical protein
VVPIVSRCLDQLVKRCDRYVHSKTTRDCVWCVLIRCLGLASETKTLVYYSGDVSISRHQVNRICSYPYCSDVQDI